MTSFAELANRIGQLVEQPQYRNWLRAIQVMAGVGFVVVLLLLPGIEGRYAQRELAAQDALQTIQGDLAELERLKERPLPPKLSGTVLKETVAASLAGARSAFSVDLVDSDRVRVRGSGDFDVLARWLGDLQRNHRLDVVTLAVTRSGAVVTLDVTLAVSRE